MSFRKARKSSTGRDSVPPEADWTIIRKPGLRAVRLGVGANDEFGTDEKTGDEIGNDAEELGSAGRNMGRWDDDEWEDRGFRRIEPTFGSEGGRRKSAPKKQTAPKKKPTAKAKAKPRAASGGGGRAPSARRVAPGKPGHRARQARSLLGNIAYGGLVIGLWGFIIFGGLLFW